MIVQKIYSSLDDDERLYSVILSEKEFSKIRKTKKLVSSFQGRVNKLIKRSSSPTISQEKLSEIMRDPKKRKGMNPLTCVPGSTQGTLEGIAQAQLTGQKRLARAMKSSPLKEVKEGSRSVLSEATSKGKKQELLDFYKEFN